MDQYLDSVTVVQAAIIAAMKHGTAFRTSHKEVGTHRTWNGNRFVRTDLRLLGRDGAKLLEHHADGSTNIFDLSFKLLLKSALDSQERQNNTCFQYALAYRLQLFIILESQLGV